MSMRMARPIPVGAWKEGIAGVAVSMVRSLIALQES
jgi:hypothetical protein